MLSIGIAACSDQGTTPQAPIRCADPALYQTGSMGRIRVISAEGPPEPAMH